MGLLMLLLFFEGMNGLLLKHIHGTQFVGLHCVQTFSMLQGFPPPEEMPTMLDEPWRFFEKIGMFLCRESIKGTTTGKS